MDGMRRDAMLYFAIEDKDAINQDKIAHKSMEVCSHKETEALITQGSWRPASSNNK